MRMESGARVCNSCTRCERVAIRIRGGMAQSDDENGGVRRLREDRAMLLAERFRNKFPNALLAQHLDLDVQRIEGKRKQEKLEAWPPAPKAPRTKKPRRTVPLG